MLNIKLPGLASLDQIINQSPIAQAAGLLGAAALGVADKPSMYHDLVHYFKYASTAYAIIILGLDLIPLHPNGQKLCGKMFDLLTDSHGYVARDDTRKEIVAVLRGIVTPANFVTDALGALHEFSFLSLHPHNGWSTYMERPPGFLAERLLQGLCTTPSALSCRTHCPRRLNLSYAPLPLATNRLEHAVHSPYSLYATPPLSPRLRNPAITRTDAVPEVACQGRNGAHSYILLRPSPSTVSFHSRAPPSETPMLQTAPSSCPTHRPPSLATQTSHTTSPATTSAARRTSEATLPSQAPRHATILLLALSRRRTTRATTPTLSTPRLRARETRRAPSTLAFLAAHSSTSIHTTLTTHDLPRARHLPLPFPILLALPYTYFVLFFHLYFVHRDRHVCPCFIFPSHLLPPRRRAAQPGTRRSRDRACSWRGSRDGAAYSLDDGMVFETPLVHSS
ncbi:hypothetical protein C8J57DRAFT_1722298 [Mycena rebaudengoi]|nr:hypothetical protein C8J57DRAFT_1722298 [Mycena rebaudengoi]